MNNMKLILFLGLAMAVLASSSAHRRDRRRQIQESMFRMLTGSAYRMAQDSIEWCGESREPGGRPYEWSKYRAMSIYLLDLYSALQFDPECNNNVRKLYNLLMATPESPVAYNIDRRWWEGVFLKTTLDAFTCGFNGSKINDFEFVSEDLAENFDTDITKQKIWYLIESYMEGQYKQRENPNRRLDFDASLYIPFLDTLTGRVYTSKHLLRVGFPSYMGRSLWFLFHSLAYRVQDIGTISPGHMQDLKTRLTSFIGYFAFNHPCPFCREHFLTSVSVNNRFANDGMENEAIRFYPIEHLLMGGTGGTLPAKLSAINAADKTSPSKFFWKLHNAVTSSVEMGCVCMTEEAFDEDPFRCVFNSSSTAQTRYPMFNRIYPTAMRFEFILSDTHNKSIFFEGRKALRDIENEIAELDSVELRKMLFSHWSSGAALTEPHTTTLYSLTDKIEQMSNIFVSLPILKEQYGTNVPFSDTVLEEYLTAFPTQAIISAPPPVPRLGLACQPAYEKELSACMKAYIH